MRTILLFCASILVAGNVLAAPVTWTADGTIAFVDNSAVLPLTPQIGEAFSYVITFDNETADTYAAPTIGNFPGAIQSAVLSIGGESYDFLIGAGSLAYSYNDSPVDYYQLSFQTQSAPFGSYPNLVTQFGFFSTSPLAINTDSLMISPPSDLSIYNVYFNLLLYQNADQAAGLSPIPFAQGRVNSIVQRAVSVPEPATIVLLVAGFLGLGLARRRA